jgi:putative nucleotidyltransferase with HDIG domain
MQNPSIDYILHKVTLLQPMPANISRVLTEVEKEDVNINALARTISLDPALAAYILRMSNSAALGYAYACTTVEDAVMHIGLKRLKSVLITFPAAEMMEKSLTGYQFESGELWQHSLITAVAAKWLAKKLKYSSPEEAYTAGLLHDLGKLILDQFVFSNYNVILSLVEQQRLPIWKVEDKLLGINHAYVGGKIAEHWSYPAALADAISFHHNPAEAKTNKSLAAIINLANAFSKDYQEHKFHVVEDQIHPETYVILRTSTRRIDTLKEQFKNADIIPKAEGDAA